MERRTRMLMGVLLLAVCPLLARSMDMGNTKWNAQWIAVPDTEATDYGVYHFRKSFHLNGKPASFVIHVSADNKYQLYVNGKFVALGPMRSDPNHWYYDTVDIAPYLGDGANTIAAVVWNHGPHKAEAQMSLRSAFIAQGSTSAEEVINTDSSWKGMVNQAYQPLNPELVNMYYVAGPGELVNFECYPWNWEQSTFDDTQWPAAQPLHHGVPKGVFDWTTAWMLVPSPIPSPELAQDRLHRVRTFEGLPQLSIDPSVRTAFTVPPHTKVTVLFDRGHLTNAYPVLLFGKGKGASISLGYAESLYHIGSKGDWKSQLNKGHRDEISGKRFVGVRDSIIVSGKDTANFMPLTWRTYRYLQLHIQTSDEALRIDDLYGLYTGYPFQFLAQADFNDVFVDRLLEIGWRTARLCAVDTYMDTPYYEQLQYVGDTRIQGLVSLFNSGDHRLLKNAIRQINSSRIAEGITLSRYPSVNAQHITPFSLWWIGMVHDYWMYVDDGDFVKEMLPGIRQVLSFFEDYQTEDGLLSAVPYWTFTDWVFTDPWQNGMPPVSNAGHSSVLDLQLVLAYQAAARLEEKLGFESVAAHYSSMASRMAETIHRTYWSDDRQLIADVPEKTAFSQHANSLGVLAGVLAGDVAMSVMERALTDTTLAQASIYFRYYVNRAAIAAGLGDHYLSLLGEWKKNMDYGLTTWAEDSEIETARSDCHAWGSSPNIEVFRTILGIDSDAPGFRKIRITPHPQHYESLSGSIPHPKGEIAVTYQKTGYTWSFTISLPADVEGVLVWQGVETTLYGGQNVVELN